MGAFNVQPGLSKMTLTTKQPLRVTSAELVRNFGPLSDAALTAPVTITKNGRDRLVLLSAEEYARLKKRERIVRRAGEMPDDLLELISKSEMDPRHDHPNDLLPKDWKP